MTGAPDPAAALAALYPSATPAKPDAPAVTPGTTAPKTAATTPAPAPAAAKPSPGTWAAPDGTPPAKAAQPDAPAEPASLYVEPLKTMEEAVAATPLPPDEEGMFDMGEEGRQAREVVRSAFLSAGASKEEVGEVWSVAMEAARPDAKITTADEAEAALRRDWGGDYDARLSRAKTYFQGIARKHPAVVAQVRALHLDNSPAFLKALHRAAARRGR